MDKIRSLNTILQPKWETLGALFCYRFPPDLFPVEQHSQLSAIPHVPSFAPCHQQPAFSCSLGKHPAGQPATRSAEYSMLILTYILMISQRHTFALVSNILQLIRL